MKIFFLFILLINSFSLQAQKVALVLSGGGAKGLAHVGVLRALEENNIPVDYIVGTSMGGVVGGFYAAGYSADQIEQMVLSDDFQDWVNGALGDNYNFYYFKKDNNASWLNINLSVDSTLNATLRSNIANDVALNFALAEHLARAAQKSNYQFDSLFIPFRAVAADIFTQSQVVLDSGRLSDALRATLSVPFFYSPIKIEDKYLFDGGVYNNFPIDVAIEEFDPDVIIGVNVSSKRFEKYPFDIDEKLIRQSLLFMLLDKTDISILREEDVYIEPDLSDYSSLDFSLVRNIVDSGYVETYRHLEELKNKIQREKMCNDLAEERIDYVLDMEPLVFEKINLVGFRSTQRKYIRSLFNINKEELNIHDIKTGYYKLVSEEYFKDIYPSIAYNPDAGSYEFTLIGKPKNYLNVEFGGNLATRSISEIFLGLNFSHFNRLLFNHTANFYTGRFYQSIQLKSRINVPVKYQFYVEPEFTFNSWDFINADDIIFGEDEPTIIKQIDRKAGLNIGLPIGTRGKLVLTGAYFNNTDRYSNFNSLASTDTLDKLSFDGLRYGMGYSRNSLNRKQYASSGSAFNLSLDYFMGEEIYTPGNTSLIENEQQQDHDWLRFKIEAEQYFSFGKYKYGYYFKSEISNQPFFSNYKASLMHAPSFYPLQDSKTIFLKNFKAFSYAGIGLRNVYTIKRNLDIRLEGYLFKPFREIVETDNQRGDFNGDFKDNLSHVYLAATGGIVFHSPIGPISLSVNYYEDEKRQWGALLHIGYTLFNKRSME